MLRGMEQGEIEGMTAQANQDLCNMEEALAKARADNSSVRAAAKEMEEAAHLQLALRPPRARRCSDGRKARECTPSPC